MKRIVVLISGSGSNLQAIIDACQLGRLKAEVVAVLSNKADAFGLQRAQQAGIATASLAIGDYADREAFDQALLQQIDSYQPDLVVLAGYMRILSAPFVSHYRGRLLNIHPSLLPKYPGLHTHRRAIENGDSHHGASIHFVTEQLDGGPVILQAAIPVLPQDTEQDLAKRLLGKEHLIYPQVIQWWIEGRVALREDQAWLDGKPLGPAGA
ncbi:phosphoribosylglycinamide formyltransferase [bacteria symbiont BFo2 of Frankliniella occidentalis]|nr:phosphoribosylglycinamide formyltransferase [bacteria symbiont BFo2 of Frankliniella occidentalis]KYP88893.1 phosphoribosylglycinamide formyltransferase [bacteria symbiont BFo2 of Frankliniella occidentalis]KYP95124.1 phosphoribosylglycinamide formyltransferase [bacteria symbiont BFo2 of Frankliniella occidentalis]